MSTQRNQPNPLRRVFSLPRFCSNLFMIVAREMMMLMLTQVKPKVFCSACSALFRSDGTRQVVDFKGFFTTFSMFVPLFQYIYKGRRVAKYFTLLSDSGRLGRTSFVQTHKNSGTMERADNEAHKMLILKAFSPSLTTGTSMEHTEQCLKIKQ